MRRERHNLFMLVAFTSPPNHVRHAICKLLVWPRWAPKINLAVRTQELNSLLFLQSQKSSAYVPVHDVNHIPWSYFLSGVLFWHLWMTHHPRACVNTCAHVCTKLTHALSRKVLILTKPKGKMYKTKPLRDYITIVSTCPRNDLHAFKINSSDILF